MPSYIYLINSTGETFFLMHDFNKKTAQKFILKLLRYENLSISLRNEKLEILLSFFKEEISQIYN